MKKLFTFAAALVVVLGLSHASFAADTGADTFKSKCAMCHGPDGSANTSMGKSMKIRDLGSADVQGQSDAQLKDIVSKGKGKMPGYAGKLTDAQIDDVVKYIRGLKK